MYSIWHREPFIKVPRFFGLCKTEEEALVLIEEIAKEQDIQREHFYIYFISQPRRK